MAVDEKTWQEFSKHAMTVQQLSESTLKETIRKLKHIEKYGVNLLADEKELEKQFYDFITKKINDISKPSLNQYIKSINRWCRFRGFELKFKKYREYSKPRRIPTTEDIQRFLRIIKNKMLRTAVYLLINSGLRASELSNLNLDDIDWENGILTVRGKGGKIRFVPLPRRVLLGKNVPSLLNYIKYHRLNTDKKALFTTKKGRLTPAYLRKLIKDAAREAGIPWIHTHSLRHYYATNLLRAGVNIRVVQELLGHADIKTTGIYLHIIETDLKQAVENPNLEDPLKVRHKRKRQPPKNQYYRSKNKIKSFTGPVGITPTYKIYFDQYTRNFLFYCFSGGDAFV